MSTHGLIVNFLVGESDVSWASKCRYLSDRSAAHWIWTGCGSMVWFLDVYTQFSTARGDQCQQRKNLASNRKSSHRVIWTGDPCETDTILTSMVEANAFTLQGWGRLALPS
jgi:hypothetical protein